MSRRFSRIREASYLNQAVNNYVAWLQNAATRPRNVGGGVARPPSVELAIEPFGFTVAVGTAVRATATTAARTQMSSAIGSYATPAGGGITLQRIPGFKAARVSLFVGTGNSTVATSEITGLRYLKYGGNSFSHPFGQSVGTDLEYEVFGAIRTALAGANRRISYAPEQRKQAT